MVLIFLGLVVRCKKGKMPIVRTLRGATKDANGMMSYQERVASAKRQFAIAKANRREAREEQAGSPVRRGVRAAAAGLR